MTPADEPVDVVDADDNVTGQATRAEVRARNLRHRATYVLVFNRDGKLFVHQRTTMKDVYPGYYDVAVGGVVGAGESYDDAARRELAEELGVTGVALRRVLRADFEDAHTRIAADVTAMATSPAAALLSSTRNMVVSRGRSR